MAERLQKVLAARGVAARRACEEMIRDGQVTVNGHCVRKLPVLVDPDHDDIRVNGRRITGERKVYYLLNKPKGVLCTAYDPAGRRRAIDLLPGVRERVYPVGRLDADSDGLLILTNDGELTNRLTHPRYGTAKTYRVEVDGRITAATVEKLKQGVWLSGGRTRRAGVKIIRRGSPRSVLEITLHEGRNRQVRRMLLRLGHRVRRLTRIRIGRLSLHGLGSGQHRPLAPDEIRSLNRLAKPTVDPPRSAPPVRASAAPARAPACPAAVAATPLFADVSILRPRP